MNFIYGSYCQQNNLNHVLGTTVPSINSFPPEQNGRHFADDIFIRILVNEKFSILIKISLKFVPKGPINNKPALL